MDERYRVAGAIAFTVVLFVLIQLGTLALVDPFDAAGYQVVEDTEDPTNSIVYVGLILVVTGFMLAAFRYDAQWLVRGIIVLVSGMLAWYVLDVVVPPAVQVGAINVPAIVGAAIVVLGLLVYPEWYVIDAAGVLMGAGAAGLFGISFGLLPAIVLLTVLAVYDAISVYKTRHMLSLAEGVMDLKLPIVLVVPTTLSYSFLDADLDEGIVEGSQSTERANGDEERVPNDTRDDESGSVDDRAEPAFERDALFVGLGDAVIPTVLVASAAFFVDAPSIAVPGLLLNAPALGAMVGTVAGLLVLLWMVLQGRAHAGLPLLNGGAIGGYLVAALASGVTIRAALGL